MPPKRKAAAAVDGDEATATAGLRRSTRRKSSAPSAAGGATKGGDDKSLPPTTARGKSTAADAAAAAAVKKESRKAVPPVVKQEDGEVGKVGTRTSLLRPFRILLFIACSTTPWNPRTGPFASRVVEGKTWPWARMYRDLHYYSARPPTELACIGGCCMPTRERRRTP